MKFGDFLRQYREKKSWTQPEAASHIEIEQSYLSKLETGKSYPSEEIFSKLVAVYEFDVEDVCKTFSSEELDKLKEIKSVRQALLSQSSRQVTTTRAWLISGLVMMLLAGGFLGAALINERHQSQYTYRSDGVLKLDEPLDTFALVHKQVPQGNLELINKQKALLPRLDQSDQHTTQKRGAGYIEEVPGGRRFYQLESVGEVQRSYINRWFFIPALMSFFGGLSCFFISRKWR